MTEEYSEAQKAANGQLKQRYPRLFALMVNIHLFKQELGIAIIFIVFHCLIIVARKSIVFFIFFVLSNCLIYAEITITSEEPHKD
mmetsp:Transcript_41085/g.62455  ORF Transcript_41085/g.62455 Transcript_41085/m.62455 type:complete len:85 (-) Transcript_41085:505-759(-)